MAGIEKGVGFPITATDNSREVYGSSAAYGAIFQQGFDEIRSVAKGGPEVVGPGPFRR